MSASTFLSTTKLLILLVLFSSFYSKGISSAFSCFHIPSTNANVCSSRGTCVATNNCTCSTGIYGSNCQWSDDPVLVEPNLEVFGLSGGIVRRNVSNPTYEVFVTATKLTYLDYKLRELLGCDLESYNCETLMEFKWSIEMNSIILDSSNGFVKGNLSQVDVMTFTPTISFQSKKVMTSGTQLRANIELKTKYSNINFTFTSPISNPSLPPSEKTPIISNGQLIDTLGTVSSISGIALSTRFTFELRSWIAAERMGPLMYAIGFYDYANKKDLQLSEFSSSRTYSTFLPYIYKEESNNGKFRALVFVSDRYGNIETRYFNIELTISPYNGTQSDVLNFMNSTLANPLDFTVYSYDQSFAISGSNNSEILLQVAKNTVIDTVAPSVGLSTIEKITEQTNLLNQEIISILNVKINNFLKSSLDLYKQNKETYGSVLFTLIDSDVRKIVTIASNIFISGYSNETKLIADNLVDLLIFGNNPTLILSNVQSLDVISYSSTSINVTIASFLLDFGLNSTQSISSGETNVNLNLTSIMEQYNGFSKESGASLVTYTRNFYSNNEYSNRNRISSNLNEFKFYKNQQVLILQDLKNPLELTFKLLNISNITLGESSFTTLDSSENQVSNNISNTLTCVYFDIIENNWSSKGCILKRNITQGIDNSVTCLCSHTTMFSTFIEQNSSFAVKVKQQLSTLYYAQISLGIFYMISSCVLLILLFIFRKEQPISSRLATPFMGMIALLVESCLIYVTQRGILVNQLKNSNTQMWESGDGDSNIIANIVTIFVNSLNLTAIFCYVIQVVRFELMKFMYKLIHKTKGNESKSDLVLKTIRFSTSSSLFLLLTTIFMTVNLVYWTIWVVLRRINVIDPSVYTYIVSISYTVVIFFLSVIICTVLVFDFIATIYEKKQETKNTVNISNSSSDSSLKEESIKKSFKIFKMNPISRVYDYFISLDEPLYFRVEMFIYLTCFVFLIVNQVIGLLGLPYRFVDEEIYKIALKYDVISFIFEVLYVLTYILVFGGYALIVLLVYKFKIWKRKSGKTGKSKENDGMLKNKELLLVLNNEESYESFEKFCEKEFSLENLYLHTLLEKNSEIVDGERMEGLSSLLNQIFEGFIQSGAPNEVNIPNSCRTKIVNLYKMYGFETKDPELKNIDYGEVKQAFFSLVQQVFVNLGDTFSRYSLTTEWKVYKKAIELKEQISEKTNLQ